MRVLALDHPERLERLAVLDIVPTLDAFERADARFALNYWVWSFLAAPYPVPEELIAASPATLVDFMFDNWSTREHSFPDHARDEYIRAFRSPERVHVVCEQYRAAATLDCDHDRTDLGHRMIDCPVLVLWDGDGAVGSWYDPLAPLAALGQRCPRPVVAGWALPRRREPRRCTRRTWAVLLLSRQRRWTRTVELIRCRWVTLKSERGPLTRD